jgi:type VI secretion system protein ImpM
VPNTPLSSAASPVGLFGKLPSAGDFVTRSLPSAFVAAWDDWLQRSLVASRAKLGNGWTEVYLESPIWRFALQPQVCSPQAWAGVIMPSVDRAGRYFPLTLAAPIPSGASTLLTVTAAEHWFAELERIALWALEPDATLEAIEALLGRQALMPVPASADARNDWDIALQLSRWWSQSGRPLSLRMPATHALPAVAEFAAAHLMESQGRGRSLWWMRDSTGGSIALRGWYGLPPPAEYTSLLRALLEDQS